MNKDKVYNNLARSIPEMISNTEAQRASTYHYRVEAVYQNNNKYSSNINFLMTNNVILSRIMIAENNDFMHMTDMTFATDLSSRDFYQIPFSSGNDPQRLLTLEGLLLDLTVPITFHHRWKHSVSYHKLYDAINKAYGVKADKVLRTMDTYYRESKGMNPVIKCVVKNLGVKSARKLCKKAMIISPLAHLWLTAFITLGRKVQARKLTDNPDQFNYQHGDYSRFD